MRKIITGIVATIMVIAGMLFITPTMAGATGSDSATQYTVGPDGISLPHGDTFRDNGHVNVKSNQGDRNIHFEGKCIDRTDAECAGKRHEDAQYIGKNFIPWTAFGYNTDTLCVNWVQISHYNQHFGEGGQEPVGKGCVDPTTEPTEEPTPDPEPSTEPTESPTDEPDPEPTEEPTDEPTEGPTSEPTPDPEPTPTEAPEPSEPTSEPTVPAVTEPTEPPTTDLPRIPIVNIPIVRSPQTWNLGDPTTAYIGTPKSLERSVKAKPKAEHGVLANAGNDFSVMRVVGAIILIVAGLAIVVSGRRRS